MRGELPVLPIDREREHWTLVEEAVGCALVGLGCTGREIANWLGRTTMAVSKKSSTLRWLPVEDRYRYRKHEFTSKEDAKIRVLWSSGTSTAEIGCELGISENLVRRRARELGLPKRVCYVSSDKAEQIKELRRSRQMSQREIAREVGCSVGTAAGQLWRAGLMGNREGRA